MDDDTTIPFPRDRMLGGTQNHLRLPEWNDAQLATLVIRQAVMYDALIQLLIAKGVITLDELVESVGVSTRERLPTILASLPRFE